MSEFPLAGPITSILNEVRRPVLDWDRLGEALEEGLAWSDVLEGRLMAGFALLSAAPGAEDLRLQFETTLSGQRAMLKQMADAVARQDPEMLQASLRPFEHAAQRLSEVVFRLRRLEEEMPRFSDIPLFDEVFTLALNQLKRKGDFSQDLMARLRPLRELIRFLDSVGEGFLARHPEQATLAGAFAHLVENLKQVSGGLFLYLQETHDPRDLSNALSLLDRTVQGLAAAFREMRAVEYASLEFSEDPVLDRLARAIEELKIGEDASAEVERTFEALLGSHRNLARSVAALAQQTFMPLSLRERYVPRMIELLEAMDAELALLARRPYDPHAMAAAVNRYQGLGTEFDEVQAELEARLARVPSLVDSSHYDELAALMHGAYVGSVPDLRLEEKARQLLALQDAFRRRLALEQRRAPEEAERLQRVLAALDGQRTALETVLHYLQTAERDLLLQAYDHLLPATLHLIQEKRQAAAAEAAAVPATLHCVYCGRENEPGTPRCAQCARPLPALALGVSAPSEVLDLYDSGAAVVTAGDSSTLSENFQFLVDVLNDVSTGVLPPEEARELLIPFWETVVSVEAQAHESVQALVTGIGDADLASYQEELTALVAYLKDTLTAIFEALEAGDLASLSALGAQAADVGEALGRFHEEVQGASRS